MAGTLSFGRRRPVEHAPPFSLHCTSIFAPSRTGERYPLIAAVPLTVMSVEDNEIERELGAITVRDCIALSQGRVFMSPPQMALISQVPMTAGVQTKEYPPSDDVETIASVDHASPLALPWIRMLSSDNAGER